MKKVSDPSEKELTEIDLRHGDQLIKNENVPVPDVVKIDVDGGEADIISELEDTLGNFQMPTDLLRDSSRGTEGVRFIGDRSPSGVKEIGFELIPMELDHQMRSTAYFVRGIK